MGSLSPAARVPGATRRRLPVIGESSVTPEGADAGPDPLALLRGGWFARVFAAVVALLVVGVVVAGRLHARELGAAELKVHSALPTAPIVQALAAAPPMPEVEELPRQPPAVTAAPPMPEVEELPRQPPAVSPTAAAPDGTASDRFGRTRTATGALVLAEGEAKGEPERGVSLATKDALAGGGFFDPSAFDDVATVQRKAYVHLMPGLPNEVFFGSSVLVLLLSFAIFERYGKHHDPRRRGRQYWSFELTRWPWLRAAVRHRWFQPAVQLPVAIGFVAVIVAGLVGSQEPGRNIAPVLTWNIWWIGLIFAVFFVGNAWCFACPWTAIPDWIMRGSFTKVRAIRTLAWKYPRFQLWMWPAIVLFAVVTWLELVFDAANRPWLTSMMGIGMVVLAWLMLVIYERKAMCRYVCFVGRVSGQYALLGMLELRRRDPQVCKTCTTKDCFHGREGAGYPCPTHEFMGAMNDNQYCTLCTECVKSCPHDNIALRVRSSGADLLQPYRAKPDEAYMALLVFIVSAFHGAAMIPLWMEWETWLRGAAIDLQGAWLGRDVLGLAGHYGGTLTFTAMMAGAIVVPGALFWALAAAMRLASGRRDVSTRRLFVRFAYTLLPIALFYHLAHNAIHVFYEWSKLRRLVSDPLGWGTDYFGTARAPLSALWSPESIWYLQVALVLIGHVYGILVAQREAFRIYGGDHRASLRVHIVMMVGMAAMSLLSLWLLAQPMFMRTADV